MVLSIVSRVFVAGSWADFVVDFVIAALKVAFISAIIGPPAIVIGCIVVSSLFF